jgi:hypothetical protein
MGFYNFRFFAKKGSKAGRTPTSNPRRKLLDDGDFTNATHEIGEPIANVRPTMRLGEFGQQNMPFRKNMEERQAKLELFLIEGIDGFERKSLRSQMTEVIQRGTQQLKDWYYDLGVEDRLPGKWTDFKELVVQYCTGKSLGYIRKYIDEPWSDYLSRLKDFGFAKNISEEEILKKVRQEHAPVNIQNILYNIGASLDDLIERIKEMENFQNGKKQNSIKLSETVRKFEDNETKSEIREKKNNLLCVSKTRTFQVTVSRSERAG